MKQQERILKFLQENDAITPLAAWQILGVYRLASRICDLKQSGHPITKKMVSVTNKFGEDCRVASYSLD